MSPPLRPPPIPVPSGCARRHLISSSTSARRRGFALLVTIVLVAFLVLLLVGLATFTRVETQVATNAQNLAKARQNALFALNLAVGELQRATGPDQRTTASAAIGTVGDADPATPDNGVPAPADGTRPWVGVWANASNPVNRLAPADPTLASHEPELPSLLTWLVSGNESASYAAASSSANFGQLTAFPSAPATLATNAPWLPANPAAAPALPFAPNLPVTVAATSAPLTPAVLATDALRLGAGPSARDAVLLVGPGSAGAAAGAPASYVAAPLVDISVSAAQIPGHGAGGPPVAIGRYAWWVGDEGAKARVDLLDPRRAETAGDEAVRRVQVAARAGIEAMDGLAAWDPASAAVERLMSENQLAFLPGLSTADARARFHDLTTHSLGVLADVAKGGLKKDLTAGLLSAPAPAEIADDRPLFNLPAAAASAGSPAPDTSLAWSGDAPARLPGWGALRSYVGLESTLNGASPSLAPRRTTDTQMGVFPVVTRAQLRFWGLVEENGGSNRVQALYFPAVVLWNPYNVTLRAHRYAFKFTLVDPYERLDGSNWNTAFSGGLPAFLAIHGPPLATGENLDDPVYRAANLNAVNAASAYVTHDRGFPLVIDCPVLAPGEARIFTPVDSAPLDLSTPSNNVLGSGYRTTFFSEPVVSAPAGRIVRYLYLAMPSLANVNYQRLALGLDASFSAAPHHDPVELVQHHTGFETTTVNDNGVKSGILLDPAAPNSATDPRLPGVDPFLPSDAAVHQSYLLASTPGTPPAWDADTLTEPYSFSAGVVPIGWTRLMNFSRKLRYFNSASDNVNIMVRWLATQNPAASETGPTLIEDAAPHRGYFDNASFSWRSAALRQSANFTIATPDLTSAYVGVAHAPRVGDPVPPTSFVLYHLPREETGTLSLGALQHAQVHPASGVRSNFAAGSITNTRGYVASTMPAYAIGNSLADPRVHPGDIDGFPNNWNSAAGSADLNLMGAGYNHTLGDSRYRRLHFDLSYLVNRALWDRYHFSSTPAAGVPFPLPNSRHMPYDPRGEQASAAFASDLRDYHRASTRLLVKGAFNINSTSVEAWTALLSSTRALPIVKTTGANATIPADASPWPRLPVSATEPLANSGTDPKLDEADRFRALSPAEIRALATELVAEIRRRGPAVSLAGFVNRKPLALGAAAPFRGHATVADSSETELHRLVGYQALMGPLQLALDRVTQRDAGGSGLRPGTASGINDRLAWHVDPPLETGLDVTVANTTLGPDLSTNASFNNSHNSGAIPFSPYVHRMAAGGFRDETLRTNLVTHTSVSSGGHYDDLSPVSLRSAATASPGHLMQADFLQALAPVLSARSDTFRIRTYGEVKNPATGDTEGRAWAEAIVQRLPDYIDQTDPALTAGANLGDATPPTSVNPANQRFGRRYRVVSFRWLGPDDI